MSEAAKTCNSGIRAIDDFKTTNRSRKDLLNIVMFDWPEAAVIIGAKHLGQKIEIKTTAKKTSRIAVPIIVFIVPFLFILFD